MAIDFPSSPTNGQAFTSGNVTWIWDGAKWGVPTSAGSSLYLPISGGTMTGDIVLKGDPDQPLEPVTKQMLDARPTIGDNRIINGDFRIDQRNAGAAITPTVNQTYTADRWHLGLTVASKLMVAKLGPVALSAAVGFPYILQITSQSAYTPLTGDTFYIGQKIEADMVSDLLGGTANAQPVTLSFWANVAVAGTYSGSLTNGDASRTYPFTFVHAATGWQKFAITIPGDTTGTWALSGAGVGLILRFDLGSGATFRAAPGAWVNGNYVGANGAVNVCATNATNFQLTGVKLEIGSVATPYNRQSLTKSMADCQRYYQYYPGAAMMVQGNTGAGATILNAFTLQTAMRAAPTAAFVSPTYSNASGIALNAADSLGAMMRLSAVITAAGYGYAISAVALTAEL